MTSDEKPWVYYSVEAKNGKYWSQVKRGNFGQKFKSAEEARKEMLAILSMNIPGARELRIVKKTVTTEVVQ